MQSNDVKVALLAFHKDPTSCMNTSSVHLIGNDQIRSPKYSIASNDTNGFIVGITYFFLL